MAISINCSAPSKQKTYRGTKTNITACYIKLLNVHLFLRESEKTGYINREWMRKQPKRGHSNQNREIMDYRRRINKRSLMWIDYIPYKTIQTSYKMKGIKA